MITSTTARKRHSAFTLAEVMIGSTIGSFVLLGVLSTFLMLGRSGANIVSYTSMDAQTRRGLEEFAQDVRMASGIIWNSETSVTLTVPDNYTTTSNQVTYAWDTTVGGANYHDFYRMAGTAAANNSKTRLIAKVTSFSYSRFNRLNVAAASDPETKRLQLSLTITSNNTTVAAATDTTISACFIMRNKTSI